MVPIWFWKEAERENILYKNKYPLPHDSIVVYAFYGLSRVNKSDYYINQTSNFPRWIKYQPLHICGPVIALSSPTVPYLFLYK